MTTGCARRQLSGLSVGTVVCGCFAGLMLVAACNSAPPPVDTKAVEDAVRAADAAWSKAAGAHDLAGTLSYYAGDATVLPPNAAMVTNGQAIHDNWAAMLTPDTALAWQAGKVEVAGSGDLAYVVGTYTFSAKDAKGKPVSDNGKYVEVWKKQADGSWKAEVDTWSSDLPAVAAKPAKAAKAAKAAKPAKAARKKKG